MGLCYGPRMRSIEPLPNLISLKKKIMESGIVFKQDMSPSNTSGRYPGFSKSSLDGGISVLQKVSEVEIGWVFLFHCLKKKCQVWALPSEKFPWTTICYPVMIPSRCCETKIQFVKNNSNLSTISSCRETILFCNQYIFWDCRG